MVIIVFQCSSASRKFLNSALDIFAAIRNIRFSALQRAENSSIKLLVTVRAQESVVSVLFSEPKIPQSEEGSHQLRNNKCFSALQRAENSSIRLTTNPKTISTKFQCSSASRKFLNFFSRLFSPNAARGFSALQRAENSSMCTTNTLMSVCIRVSVLFSEPKIPQWQV